MAAYEVLLLNTAIPQIQAAQSGDTYVVPRDIAFSTVANLANGTNLLPSLTFSSDTNTGIYREGADALGFTAGGGTNQMVLTSTGLGIGTNNPGAKLSVVNAISAGNIGTSFQQEIVNNNSAGVGDWSGTIYRWLPNNANTNQAYIGAIVTSNAGDTLSDLVFGVKNSTSGNTIVEAMRISKGNLGLGVTPSAWDTSVFRTLQVGAGAGSAALFGRTDGANNAGLSANYYYGTGNPRYVADGFATYYNQQNGIHSWHTAPNNTSGAGAIASFTQAMTLDASGNLGVGSTTINVGSYDRVITVAAIAAAYGAVEVSGTTGGAIDFQTSQSTRQVQLLGNSNGFVMLTNGGSGLAERARITSGGDLLVGVTSAITIDGTAVNHAFQGSTNGFAVGIQNTNNSTPLGLAIKYTAAAPNGTGSQFLYCSDNLGVNRAEIRSNGGLANYQANDVNLSDQRVKKDIVAAPSYWDKIKGIEIVHFKYKDQTHDDNNVGVIAQQVEQVAPEFVDQNGWGDTPEDGVPLKSIYTSDMHHAAIKALQEAMARIEKLEAEVAALKGA